MNFSNLSLSPGPSKTLIDFLMRSYGVISRRLSPKRAADSDDSGRSLYFVQCRRAPLMAVCLHPLPSGDQGTSDVFLGGAITSWHI